MATRPDLALVVPGLDIGGTERHLLALTPKLVAAGFSLRVLTLRDGALVEDFARAGVAVDTAPGSLPRQVFYLWRWLRHWRPRLAHFYLPKAYLLGCLCLPADIPAVMSRRSLNHYQARHRLARSAERWCHRRIALALANSQAIAAQLHAEGIAPAKTRVIYNGIDLREPPAATARLAARQALGLKAEETVFLKVANLFPYKGHADVVDAAGELRERLSSPWRVLFVGKDQGEWPGLEARLERMGLADRVTWCGVQPDISPYLAAADIGLLASHEEGLSTFILEAMAAGLPVIATRVGGNAEAVRDGRDGLLVEPRTPAALARAMQTLAQDAAQRSACGAAARARVAEKFGTADMLAGYVRAYNHVLGVDGTA